MAIGLGFVHWFAAVASLFLVERVGRKFLLLLSFGGMVLTIFCFSLAMIMMVRNTYTNN